MMIKMLMNLFHSFNKPVKRLDSNLKSLGSSLQIAMSILGKKKSIRIFRKMESLKLSFFSSMKINKNSTLI
jgi:hypothetical protein